MATKIYYNSLDKTCKSIIGAITVGDDLKITVISSDATTCRLILRYDGEYECGYDMEKCEDGFFISLSDLKSGLIWYYFVIDNVNYGNDGFCKAILQSDVVPFQLSVCKKRKSSCNLKKAIMYQIMPDRFARAEGYGDANGKKLRTDWGGMPEYLPDKNGKILNNDFFGGNLEGIRRKLPYLKSLGVTHIYLNPIFKAYSNHRYDTGDYLTVDPLLGDENDLINFIQDAKKYTMCVILDGVFNHTGDDSIYFNKYGNYKSVGAYQSENSPYYNWYTFIDYPDKYESWWGISVLPTVRKNCREFENFITGEGGVIDKYSALGVGGFRLDVVDELPDRFVKSIYSAIKKRNENNIVIGEVWEDATNKIAYGKRRTYFTERELDGVMNYPLKNAIINFVLTGKNAQLKSTVISQIDHYPAQNLSMLMNILGTHDTPRILTVFGKNGLLGETREEQSKIALTDEEYTLAKKRLKVAAFLSYFLYGFPCVYYGDEIGMQGGKDPFNRRCFEENNADNDLLEFYKKLGKIKDKYSCLSGGETFGVGGEGGVFYFKRRDKNGVCLAVANCGELPVTITLKESADEIMSDIKLNKITLKTYDFTMFYKIRK